MRGEGVQLLQNQMPTNRLAQSYLHSRGCNSIAFWAAKDKARLERLRATAIEVPEPEVQPAAVGAKAEAAPEVSTEIPGLAFDEGVLVVRNSSCPRSPS